MAIHRLKAPNRRDRIATQVALLVLTVAGLLTIGGASWLMHAPAAEAGRPEMMAVVDQAWPSPRHPVQPQPAHVEPIHAIAEPAALPAPSAAVEPAAPVVQPPTDTRTTAAAPLTFDARPIRPAKTMRMLVTAYSPDERSCGKWAKYKTTASGYSVYTNGMRLVAADRRILPFGSILTIPGYSHGQPVPVLDVGGAIKGNRLDVLFATHEQAMKWGEQWITVTVWDYADK